MPAPRVGEIVDGYEFLGGNPNDKNSWAEWGPGTRSLPDGSIVRDGARGGLTVLRQGGAGGSSGSSGVDPQAQFDNNRQTLKLIDDAKKKVNWFSTGQLGVMGRGQRTDTGRKGGWGGSPGYELEESFMPLRARIKLAAAAALKAQGVSLNPISNTDAASLEAMQGSLDVGRKEAELNTTLGDVRGVISRQQKGLDKSNPYDLAQDQPATVPQGALFRGPDGKLYTNTRGAGFPGVRSASGGNAGTRKTAPTRERVYNPKTGRVE
jgi:hypothetical protein